MIFCLFPVTPYVTKTVLLKTTWYNFFKNLIQAGLAKYVDYVIALFIIIILYFEIRGQLDNNNRVIK